MTVNIPALGVLKSSVIGW